MSKIRELLTLIGETAYSDFLAKGGKDSEWDAYRDKMNAQSRSQGAARLVQDWKSGKELNGNDLMNLLRSKNVPVPDDLKKTLQHDHTMISKTSAQGRGLGRSEAAKLHKFVSDAMSKIH